MLIIDDVEVEECKYYREKDKNCDVWGIPCNMKENCYFKQLKRLEKENEIITMENQEAREIVAELKHENEEFKKENEELKHKNENLRIALSTYEMPEVAKVLTDWRTGELQLQENGLNKYKQALEEIREIAEENKDTAQYSGICRSILTKINEVMK